MKLKALTYNTLFGGRDGNEDRRALAQIELVNELRPNVFLMQEAKAFDLNGSAWLFETERRLGMRGFLAPAPRTGQHVAIFIREPLRPISFDADGANFHHALATLKVALPNSDRVLTLLSAHLCPNGPAVRRREAAYLAVQAAPNAWSLLTGDFNSASPHDLEPVGFDELALHHRARYLADDLKTADRSVLGHLEAAGWVDVGHALGGNDAPTVPTTGFVGTAFATMRCDYVLASPALAAHASSYRVIRTPLTDMASDHYPVMASFEVSP
ncbi:endonuclease/exonuclease/phosphatase family protein [Variovorax sp. Sphag1AA]|uniref:endonuclease/exonuclease/phosphatase family protein n=1 Tax=Variovorax sp. Sphag1AA TaxID=2587027 RepID=UPI0016127F7D|nr:endonuclease/exonuclease/phosphatase family protein [Variovorax sp. Sphag1AA]MBB3181220.1 endonuclease/exonuclease/phosphatase family metal-dependent hydrolase [Variovorax sp. Sphag1AA]